MNPIQSMWPLAIAAVLFAAAPEVAAQVTVTTSPYAGLMFNERESHLPGSPVAGGHALVEFSPLGRRHRDGIRTFVGADVAVAAVDEIMAGSENSELHLDLYLSGRAGITLASSPGHPRVFGTVGAAFPGPEPVWNSERRQYEGTGSTLTVGGGLSFTAVGLMLEGRVVMDQRFKNQSPSVMVVIGYGR